MKAATGLLMLALTLQAAAASSDREVTVDADRAPLHGALRVADPAMSSAAALIIAGSGPTDRDGNSLKSGISPNTLKLLAQGLADRGITSLRFDKRGIAASAAALSSEADITLTTEVQDVQAWERFLLSQPHVACVVLVGHSEGALLATLAAREAGSCGIVTLAGAGRRASEVLKEQLAAQPIPAALLAKLDAGIDSLNAGRRVQDVPPALMSLLRPSVQPYLLSWLPVDPAAALARVSMPVLILQGDRDLQVRTDDARRLGMAHPGARVEILDGVNHVLKRAPADRAGNLATYRDPSLPLDPRVTDTVAAFIQSARPRR